MMMQVLPRSSSRGISSLLLAWHFIFHLDLHSLQQNDGREAIIIDHIR